MQTATAGRIEPDLSLSGHISPSVTPCTAPARPRQASDNLSQGRSRTPGFGGQGPGKVFLKIWP